MAFSSNMGSGTRKIATIGLLLPVLLSLSTCDLFKVGLGEKVDISAPEIAITSPANGAYISGDKAVTGTASDDIEVKSVTAAITFDASSGIAAISKVAAFSSGSWSFDLDSAALAPGKECNATVIVTATDSSGKTAQQKIIVYIDNKAPSITLSSPSPDKLNSDYFNGSIMIEGKADTDVSSLVFDAGGHQFTSSNKSAFAIQVDTELFKGGEGGVTVDGADPSLLLVPYTFYAADGAGNKSEIEYTGTLHVKQSSDTPEINFDAVDASLNAVPLGVLNSNRFASGEVVSGSIEDDDGIDLGSVSITLSPDAGGKDLVFDGADGLLTLKAQSSGTEEWNKGFPLKEGFSFAVPSGLAQGVYWLSVHVADNAKAKLAPLASSSLPERTAATFIASHILFLVDDGAPTLTIDSPAAGAFLQSLSASGNCQDGLGVLSIQYQIDSKSDSGWTTVTNAGAGTNYNWSFASAAPLGDGSHTLYVRGIGKAGDYTNPPKQVDFTVDTTGPSIKVLSASPAAGETSATVTEFAAIGDASVPGKARCYVNGWTRIKGMASDSVALKSVSWELKKSGEPAILSGEILDSSKASWSVDIDTRSLSDGGRYVFAVTAMDQAGNTSVAYRTLDVRQSGDLPTFTLKNMTSTAVAEADAGTNLLVNDPKLTGVVYDDDWVDSDSISMLIDKDPASASASDWKAVSVTKVEEDGSADFSFGFSETLIVGGTALGEGRHRLYLKASDKDGSEGRKDGLSAATSVSGPVWFAIDNGTPVITFDQAGQGIYVSSARSLSGTVSDGNKVKSLLVKRPGDSDYSTSGLTPATFGASSSAWTYSLDVSGISDGSVGISFKATDEFDRTTIQSFTVTVDKTPPQVEFVSVSPELSGKKVNGIIAVKGTASDANPIDSVSYSVGGADFTASDLGGNLSSWNFRVDTRSCASGPLELRVKAVDRAGNEGVTAYTVVVDQDSDKPTFSLSNASLVKDSGDGGADIVSVADLFDSNGYVKYNGFTSTSPKLIAKAMDDDWVNGATESIEIQKWDGSAWISAPVYSGGVSEPGSSALESAFSHSFSSLSDGFFRFRLGASDTNDGTNNRKLGLPPVSGESGWVVFGYDRGAPTLSIASAPAATNGAFVVSGSASDGNAVKKVEISTDGSTYAAATSFSGVSWSCSGSLSGSDGSHKVYIRATDEFKNEAIATVDILLDKTPPTLEIKSPTAGGILSGSAASLSGTAIDNVNGSGVARVEYALVLKGHSLSADDWKTASGGTSWSNALNTVAPALAEGSYILYARATDAAGNTSSTESVGAIIDQESPAVSLSPLSSRILSATAAMGGLASDPADASVGGATNGIASVVYSIDDQSFSSSHEAASSASYTTSAGFSFTPSASVFEGLQEGAHTVYVRATDKAGRHSDASLSFTKDTTAPAVSFRNLSANIAIQDESPSASVSISDANGLSQWSYQLEKGSWSSGAWTYAPVTSFGGTASLLSGEPKDASPSIGLPSSVAEQGRYRLRIQALDAASPANAPASGSEPSVDFFIDREAPDLSVTALGSAAYRDNFILSGAAADESGVLSVKVRIDSRTLMEASSSDGFALWNIPVDVATPYASGGLADGNHTITVIATDRAGKTTTQSASFIKDTTPPVVSDVSVATLLPGSYVNGDITLSGAASDAVALDRVDILVTGKNVDGSDYSRTFTRSGAVASSSWTEGLATKTLFKDGTDLVIVATAYDAAGNSASSKTATIHIDQSTDIPVVKLSNISADPASPTTLKLSKTVYGTVTDDDGVGKLEVSPDGSSWAALAIDGSSWSYTSTGIDGTQKLYFRVTDAKSTVFTDVRIVKTADPVAYVAPPVTFKVDTTPPAINASVLVDSAAPYRDADYAELASGATFGGASSGAIMLKIEASDANGIANVTAEVAGKDRSAPASGKIVSSAATPTGSDGAYTVYTTSSTLDFTGLVDSNLSLTITVTDGSGLTTTLTKSIVVDNSAPTLSFLTPSSGAVVNGEVTVKGLANDNLSGLKSIRYKVGKNYASEPWTDVTGSLFNWEIGFTGSNKIDNYANSTYGTDDGSGIWTFPIILQAIDKAGNIYTTGPSDYFLRLDPGGDKPTVTLLYPTDPSTPLGGSVRVYGTASDDDAVYKVFMQIDANNDGAYDSSDTAGGTDWYAGGNGREVSGTNNWSQIINSSGEFNPSGNTTRTIKFRVRAQDTKNGSSGDIYGPWVSSSITFDNNVPKIGSSVPLYLDRDTTAGNGNETTYAQGMYISGTWYLRGSVEDDSAIADIQVTGAVEGSLSSKPSWFAKTSDARYDLLIPISTSANEISTKSITITAVDNTSPQARSSSMSLRFEVDNAAPTGAYGGDLPAIQSNGCYKVKGTADDASGSGIKKIELYFVRTGSTTRFYRPSPAGGANTVVRLDSAGTSVAFSNGSAIYPSNPAYLLTVDYQGVETADAQDADGYLEKLKQGSGTSYDWYMDINSLSIPDGPIDIHYVVYDMAGNATHYAQHTTIQNNGPGLASVYLGTDLDGNGSVDSASSSSELASFPFVSGSASTSFVMKAAPSEILPVITGGNGALYYRLSCTTASGGSFAKMGVLRSSAVAGVSAIDLDSSDLATIGDGSIAFSLVVWDTTEETVNGSNEANAATPSAWNTSTWTSLNSGASIGLKTKLIDNVPPSAAIKPFFWNGSSDNSLFGNSTANGHIELAGVLTASQPDVSGKVVIRGTAFDDQRLTALWMHIDGFDFPGAAAGKKTFNNGLNGSPVTLSDMYYPVAAYSGGAWTGTDKWDANGWKFTVTDVSINQDGHRVSWELSWDSSRIENAAGTGKNIRVIAEDKRASPNASAETADATTAASNTPLYTVDVVPYITSIGTALSGANAGVPSAFNRSALGKYPVRSSESIDIYGFNLDGASTGVRVNGNTSLAVTEVAGETSSHIKADVGTTATSGPLTVVVSAIVSQNNDNDNALAFNKEANGVNNDTLTDDRSLYVWDLGALVNSTQLTSPVMKMDASGNYYLSYGSGATNMYFNKNGNPLKFEQCYNKFHNTVVAFDSSGNYYGGATDTDRVSNNVGGATSFTFYAKAPGDTVDGNTAHYNNGSNKRHLELSYNGSTGVYDINRVQIPKMAVIGAGTNADPARIYLSYFDGNNASAPVKFRYGTVGASADSMSAGLANDLSSNNPGSASGYQTVATSASTYPGGLYTAVGATSTGVAVMAWYDATNRRLIYSYNDSPAGSTESQWQSHAIVIDSSYAGWYVDLAVDANNGIHIAYYNSGTGDLKYAFLSSYDDKKAEVVTVDSYLSTGQQIMINTRAESRTVNGTSQSVIVPYISYYSSSFMQTTSSLRVAWRSSFASYPASAALVASTGSNGVGQGAVGDKFTGNWEVMTIPTVNVPVDGVVCNGVPTSGTYKNSVFLGYYTDAYYERAYIK